MRFLEILKLKFYAFAPPALFVTFITIGKLISPLVKRQVLSTLALSLLVATTGVELNNGSDIVLQAEAQETRGWNYVTTRPSSSDLITAEIHGKWVNYLSFSGWKEIDTKFAQTLDGFVMTGAPFEVRLPLNAGGLATLHNNNKWDVINGEEIKDSPMDMSIQAIDAANVPGAIETGTLVIPQGKMENANYVIYRDAYFAADLIYYVHHGSAPRLEKLIRFNSVPTPTSANNKDVSYRFKISYSTGKPEFVVKLNNEDREWREDDSEILETEEMLEEIEEIPEVKEKKDHDKKILENNATPTIETILATTTPEIITATTTLDLEIATTTPETIVATTTPETTTATTTSSEIPETTDEDNTATTTEPVLPPTETATTTTPTSTTTPENTVESAAKLLAKKDEEENVPEVAPEEITEPEVIQNQFEPEVVENREIFEAEPLSDLADEKKEKIKDKDNEKQNKEEKEVDTAEEPAEEADPVPTTVIIESNTQPVAKSGPTLRNRNGKEIRVYSPGSKVRGIGLKEFQVWDSGEKIKKQNIAIDLDPTGISGEYILTKYIPVSFFDGATLPVYTDTTSTFYPDPNVETTSVDGHVSYFTAAAWSTVHDATVGSTVADSDASATIQGYNDSGFAGVSRIFTLFDTSSIPNNATINSATYSLFESTTFNGANDGNDFVSVVTTSPASNTALALEDYDQIGTTEQHTTAERKDITTGIADNAYNNWTLNATGISNISLTGITKFGAREGHDLLNTPPGSSYNEATFLSAETAGTTSDPKLVVVYTAVDTTSPGFNFWPAF